MKIFSESVILLENFFFMKKNPRVFISSSTVLLSKVQPSEYDIYIEF